MSFSGTWGSKLCCQKESKFLPYPIEKLYIFDVMGFTYSSLPKWYDELSRQMTPLQLRAFPEMLLYRWLFYKGRPQNTWYLKTSEDVFPTIIDRATNTLMLVKRVDRIGGLTLWKVSFPQ